MPAGSNPLKNIRISENCLPPWIVFGSKDLMRMEVVNMNNTEELLRARDAAHRAFVQTITAAIVRLYEEQLRMAEELSRIPGLLAAFWERLTGDDAGIVAVEESHRAFEAHAARVKYEIEQLEKLNNLGYEEDSNGKR